MSFINLPDLPLAYSTSAISNKYKNLPIDLNYKICRDNERLLTLSSYLNSHVPLQKNYEFREIELDHTDPSFYIPRNTLYTKAPNDKNLIIFTDSVTSTLLCDKIDCVRVKSSYNLIQRSSLKNFSSVVGTALKKVQ